ncbi:MAG TPA: pitrilysin family protein [bacterium]|nr:pitrilysin family protein [bacterium]HPO08798.1 pitrilysin family protein [bacterium]HQO35386.1 pitrilysin family protein [bacterium]HQP97718.1 pitrilysin family protein [bacterium]
MALDLTEIARSSPPIERRVLGNGTVIVHQASPANQIVAIKVLAPIGSVQEPAELAGLANLSIRLLPTGTSRHTEHEISLALEANGAHFSAEAGKDASTVFLLSTQAGFAEDFEVLLDLLCDPVFPDKPLARDREVVQMMIREEDDSPFNFTYRLFREFLFGSHPYGWPSLGLEETVARVQREHVVDFSLRQRRPESLIVILVGGDERSSIVDSVAEQFLKLPPLCGEALLQPPAAPDEPANHGVREEHREGEAEWIVSGTFAPDFNSEDFAPFRVLDSVLAGSMDSRLFVELREKRGLVYQVGSQYTPHFRCGVYALYAVSTPENRPEILRLLENECERLKEEPVGEDELERAKRYLIGRQIMGLESNSGRASALGIYELSGQGAERVCEYPQRIARVTAPDIRRVAQCYLNRFVATITTPRLPDIQS